VRSSLTGQALEQTDDRRRRIALQRADRAVRIAPLRPAARELRAMARWAVGDRPGAYADFVEASRLYPMNEEYRVNRDMLGRLIEETMARQGSSP
jgi:hypothetical protein